MSQRLIITRMNPPTAQDTAPFKTICYMYENYTDAWIQLSKDDEKPNWVSFRFSDIENIANSLDLHEGK